jgi:hypothetical protein
VSADHDDRVMVLRLKNSMKRNLLSAAAIAICAMTARSYPLFAAQSCAKFGDNQKIELQGRVVQSATTEEEEGEPPHNYMAILLDNPICWTKDTKDSFVFLAIGPADIKWLGHYVKIRGVMRAGDAWGLEVQSIEDSK